MLNNHTVDDHGSKNKVVFAPSTGVGRMQKHHVLSDQSYNHTRENPGIIAPCLGQCGVQQHVLSDHMNNHRGYNKRCFVKTVESLSTGIDSVDCKSNQESSNAFVHTGNVDPVDTIVKSNSVHKNDLCV